MSSYSESLDKSFQMIDAQIAEAKPDPRTLFGRKENSNKESVVATNAIFEEEQKKKPRPLHTLTKEELEKIKDGTSAQAIYTAGLECE